jgi:cytosine/adenosine deaminase-related metal-dependent hydrolase
LELLLKNISWVDGGNDITNDIRISRGVISDIGNLIAHKNEKVIDFQNHFLYPGLINAHDHLEMNLYPLMGKPPYNNYTEWGHDIYKPKESPVREIESIDIKDRLMWGGIKNLISGVTTVVHHNPWHRLLAKENFPVHVKETPWAHSMASEKNIQKKFPKKDHLPFVIHAAEGVDSFAAHEIEQLKDLSLLKENTVVVHAVATNEENLSLIQQANASVVWCPSSNQFMFNQTAPINRMKSKVRIALGTDSTMTGSATLLDEMRVALKTEMATPKEIYNMVTSLSARIFGLALPEIRIGNQSNFWITPKRSGNYYENIFSINPSGISAVFVNGELRYGDNAIATSIRAKGYTCSVAQIQKWIAYDIFTLKKRIESKAKSSCRENSVWKMFFE